MAEAATKQLTGTVKSVKRAEGFGFIAHDATGIDHFFHRSMLQRTCQVPWDEIEEGMRASFTPIEGPMRGGRPQERAIEVMVYRD